MRTGFMNKTFGHKYILTKTGISYELCVYKNPNHVNNGNMDYIQKS